jgi:xanthine dehydrogenase accessory factor
MNEPKDRERPAATAGPGTGEAGPAATADDGRDGRPEAVKGEGEVGGGQHGGGSGGQQAPWASTVLEQAGELTRRGEAFALATVVWRQGPSSGQQGSRAIITESGELRGWIGGACAEPTVIREAQGVIAQGAPRLLLLGSPEQFGAAIPEGMTVVPISCQSEGALEVYIEPVLPAPHLVVVGRSPMAHTVADLARALGWRAEVVDGPEFTTGHASERSMVIVATQGHYDEEAVEQAAAARPAYLGLVGSRRRGAAVLGYLAERGVPQDQLDQVHTPAGLDLGKTTHEEIAVAILAELVQLRASGALGSVSTPGAPKAAGSRQPAQAIDPVCGMTVAADASGRPLEHEGVAYYFCSSGCRRAFEQEPAAYVKRETRC